MSTIKLAPHKQPALVDQIAAIINRGEASFWEHKHNESLGWASLNQLTKLASPSLMIRPSKFPHHPHYAQWHEWQELVKSGAVERGEAWIEWLHFGEWKKAVTHQKHEGCEWRADTEYKIVRAQPKLKLIDWRRMPEGVMTNIGEILATYLEGVQVTILEIDQFILQFRRFEELRLAPADQQPWLLWMGGECPVPEGVMTHVILRNTNRVVLTKPGQHHWQHDGTDNDFIAYRITGLAPGWTDEPEKAK